jgi:hypothetical protein
MKKTVKDSTIEELEDFNSIMDAVMKYLDMYWDVEAKPKGYDEYLKAYSEGDTNYEEYEFDDPLDTSASCPSFPNRLSKLNIAYSHKEQDITPLRELIGAVFTYGMNVGIQMQRINKDDMWAVRSARDVLVFIVENRISAERLKERAENAISNLEFKYPPLKEE